VETPSPFSNSTNLDEERVLTNAEFNAQIEAQIYANALILKHPLVSAEFDKLCQPLKDWTGGHFQVLPSQSLLWEKATHREHELEGPSIATKWTFYVFWPLRHGSSDGHGTNQRIVARIEAEQLTLFRKENSALHLVNDGLHIKFMGFCSGNFEPLINTSKAVPFKPIYSNIPEQTHSTS